MKGVWKHHCLFVVPLFQCILLALFVLFWETAGLECPRHEQIKKYTPSVLRVAAFNIQRFGKNKMSQPGVVDILVKILSRYDVVLIEEIVDKEQKSLELLVEALNSKCNSNVYTYNISERVGRTVAKEQYAYVFRKDAVKLAGSFKYNDVNDIFEREPYIATFLVNGRQSNGALRNFTMIGIHTKPTAATTELQHLHEAVEFVESNKRLADIMVLGDFNGDCEYVRKKHWPTIPLWSESSKYDWLIETGTDTTTKATVCAYDRIVVTGNDLKKSVVTGSAVPFRFDTEFQLNQQLTEQVSDHYPVEVELQINY